LGSGRHRGRIFVNIDLERIREIVDLVRTAQVSELTICEGDGRLTVKKPLVPAPLAAALPEPEASSAPMPEPVETPAGPPTDDESADDEPADDRYEALCATMVGTFHLADKPGGDPLVRVGQQVEIGQVVGSIEAMKLRHEVHAPVAGMVVQIVVEDGQPVQYGGELMLLDLDPAGGE